MYVVIYYTGSFDGLLLTAGFFSPAAGFLCPEQKYAQYKGGASFIMLRLSLAFPNEARISTEDPMKGG